MPDLNKKYLFRMTHIENIPHILKNGVTHSTSPNANPDFVPIGDGSLIETRNAFILKNGKRLGDYIPFYFGKRTPMLFVVQKGYNTVDRIPPQDIVYYVTSIQKIIDLKLDFVFTDGHAVDGFTTQYTLADIENIDDLIDPKAINAKYWRTDNDLDLKRRKEAEFLVLGDISTEGLQGFLVYDQLAKDRMIGFGSNEKQIQLEPDAYF